MKRWLLGLSALAITGCATTQMTSGAAYNARTSFSNYAASSDVDNEIAKIAAVEPNLTFPARIGIAYVSRGQLQAVPGDHLQSWSPLAEKLQPDLGEIVPISPLITQMVAKFDSQTGRSDTINNIRRGAVRQHVDYVLIYEASQTDHDKRKNALSVTDLSIIGMFLIPSREVEVEAAASAILLDVRNGYPYGTATGIAVKDGLTTATRTGSKRRELQDNAKIAAIDALAVDVGGMFEALIAELENKT